MSFGGLRYGEEKAFTVVLHNSGPVEGLFHFIPPPGSDIDSDVPLPGLPAWVKAYPEEGIVPPGGRSAANCPVHRFCTACFSACSVLVVPSGGSVEMVLYLCVDGGPGGAAATLANSANDFLDAIVILRVCII